jgi:hypothetical protein
MPSRIVLLLALACAAICVSAEQPTSPNGTKPATSLQATINEEFGDGFQIDPKFAPLTGDFDSDGTEDLAIVAFAKNPLANSNEKKFKVADPYDSYFGFGDPKVTTKFADFGDGTAHCVLIIHDWHNATPKGKFVIVNLPFEKLDLSKMPRKKKTIVALSATELGGLNALVYWDGKKYKWEPTDFSSDTSQLK